jgi:hypothetical protein
VPLTSNAPEKPCVSLNRNSDNKVFNSQTIQESQDGKLDSKSVPKIPGSNTPWCPEVRRSSSSLVIFLPRTRQTRKHLYGWYYILVLSMLESGWNDDYCV